MLDDIPEHQAQGKPGWDEIALLLAYCAHQTLGNVPCPRKPVVSPIWALVPRSRLPPPPRCLHLSCGKLPKRVCRKSQTFFSPPWGMNPFSVGCPKVSLNITCHKYRSRRILTMSWIQMSPVPADLLLDSPLLTVGASIRRCCLVSGGHSTCKHRSTDNYNRHEM